MELLNAELALPCEKFNKGKRASSCGQKSKIKLNSSETKFNDVTFMITNPNFVTLHLNLW